MWKLAPAFLASSMLLAACATRPYVPPSVPVPAAFSQGANGPSSTDAEWWTVFDDPELTSLVTRALASNLDVQQAVSRVRQARQQERVTRGAQGPQINASAEASDATLSKNALPSALTSLFGGNPGQTPSGSGIGLPGETFQTYLAGFDASWELDFFGGQRSANDAAHARAEAAIWSRRDAEVTLAAEVANDYEQYRAFQRRLTLADESLQTQTEALAFLKVRAGNGLVTDTDVRRQEQQVAQAAAQREDLIAQADARMHALATLLALAPNALAGELSQPSSGAPLLVDVPPGLPSDLLKRRPDIRAAERQVAAARADVGVATADLYPKVTLTGGLQLASRSLSTLLESDSLQDNASGRLSIPLLNRGQLHATVSLRQAQAEEAEFAYRKAVFSSLRDVEDALTRLAADRRRLGPFQASARAAQDEADTAQVQYRNGLIAAADMLTAREAWRTAADAQVQAEGAAAQDMVSLYKALGGGWDDHRNPTQEDK
jgi:NodT family efflux transporter outer membrane factor (OMF) lipoprotein